MRLIIAEKKSVGTAIAQALNGTIRTRDGWIEAPDADSIVTWAQGHLVDLATPQEYDDHEWGKWSLDTLPIDPGDDWKWHVNTGKGADRQYHVIERLLANPGTRTIVNACDPDREGEAIFRRIIRQSHATQPAWRLWVASLEPDAIRHAFDTMKPESQWEGLAQAADIRAKADWLIGMNATRAYSLIHNARLPIGRVQTPTLAIIVERDRKIADHRPEPFWTVVADMGGWRLTSERYTDRGKAENVHANVTGNGLAISDVSRRKTRERPPRLYDLTGLQKDMSRLHGMTAAATLKALQRLYELKLATYPRTDSQYITGEDLPTLRNLTSNDRLSSGFIPADSRPAAPRLDLTVDDSKVAGHTAILPTGRMSADKLEELDDAERKVITRIVRRMWEAVADDCEHAVTEVKAECDGERFTAKSDQITRPGWRAIETTPETDDEQEDDETANIIPVNLTAGIVLRPGVETRIVEGRTTPPKPFTEATLLNAMEHASRFVDDRALKQALDDDSTHSGGIGTPATRADIIEKLVRSGYVERKARTLRSTTIGRQLIDIVSPTLKDVELTASMEHELSLVEHGEKDPAEVMQRFRDLARMIPGEARHTTGAAIGGKGADGGAGYGSCPRCGEPVVKAGRMWQCSTNRSRQTDDGAWQLIEGCGWKLFATIAGRKLTDGNVRTLLGKGRVRLKGFTSKTGKPFGATLIADAEHGCRFDFGDNPKHAARRTANR